MKETIHHLAGIDLAWVSERNPTAIAHGRLEDDTLRLEGIKENVVGVESIVSAVASLENLHGIAIDASLIITNATGQRPCEAAINTDYRAKKAGCHPTNQSLYPDADSVKISNRLLQMGFDHVSGPEHRWQLECYPHPALIEIFGLEERHLYKKGSVDQKRHGQCRLAEMLVSLSDSPVLKLLIPASLRKHVDSAYIHGLRGKSLKHNEDVLDAIVCFYVAGLYQSRHHGKIYGDKESGYVYVPNERCI